MIYVAQILDMQFVKIGFSEGSSAEPRIASLQTGCPFQIKEVFHIDGTLRQEQTLHSALFAAFGRIRIPMPPNEWYPGRPKFFCDFLENLKVGFDFGLTFAERYNAAVKQLSPREGRGDVTPNIKWPRKAAALPSAGDWG